MTLPKLLLIAVALLKSGTSSTDSQDSLSLTSVKPAIEHGRWGVYQKPFDMTSTVFSNGIAGWNPRNTRFYQLDGKYVRLTGTMGVNQGADESRATFKILVDGKTVQTGEVEKEMPLIPVDLDLRGKKVLMLDFSQDACIAEPLLHVNEPKALIRPELLSPSNRTHVTGKSVTFKWKEIPGASGYVVRIQLSRTTREMPQSFAREWVTNVKEPESSLKFNIDQLPSGSFSWVVVAYGPREQLGVPSLQGTFLKDD